MFVRMVELYKLVEAVFGVWCFTADVEDLVRCWVWISRPVGDFMVPFTAAVFCVCCVAATALKMLGLSLLVGTSL
jgi:hypothetical protein